MSNFTLANCCSINLNYLIYINNLYENYHGDCNKFPWIPLEDSCLLNATVIKLKLKDLWSEIVNSFMNSEDLVKTDFDYWHDNKFSFSQLFSTDLESMKSYNNIKKTYESWYCGIGYRMNDLFSDSLVDNYYHSLVNMADSNGLILKDMNFYLQVVYNVPPCDWQLSNENMIIISPTSKLPKTEELIKICTINC